MKKLILNITLFLLIAGNGVGQSPNAGAKPSTQDLNRTIKTGNAVTHKLNSIVEKQMQEVQNSEEVLVAGEDESRKVLKV